MTKQGTILICCTAVVPHMPADIDPHAISDAIGQSECQFTAQISAICLIRRAGCGRKPRLDLVKIVLQFFRGEDGTDRAVHIDSGIEDVVTLME